MTKLALFDMDRTLLRTETASLYVRYQREMGEASLLDLARTMWWVAQYTLGVLDASKVAEKAARSIAGNDEAWMARRADDFFARYVERHLTARGRARVEEHLRAGDVCAIVTGATVYTARPLARLLAIEFVVGSELEVDASGRFTGKPREPVCLGQGKLARARRFAEEQRATLDDAVFYTDSVSDLPLLERVGRPIAVNPDARLARAARSRGWPIEVWD